MRHINEIIVHCAAVRADWMKHENLDAKVAEIRRWHMKDRGWKDIGYHFIIDRDGQIAEGRAVSVTGAHVAGRNSKTVGLCLIGGHASQENDKFQDHFTPEQDAALRGLISDLRSKHPIEIISGHNEYAAKACPGFQVSEWLGEKSAPRSIVKEYPTLKIGDQGPDVKILQIELGDVGYFSGKVDGHFGKLTRAAVLAFQADNSLTTDGIAGEKTRARLKTSPPRDKRDVTMDDLAESGTLKDLDEVDRGADVGALGGIVAGVPLVTAATDAAEKAQDGLESASGLAASLTGFVTAYWPALVLVGGVMVFWLFFRGKTMQTRGRRLKDAINGKHVGR